jgi:esterase/lipase
MSEPSSSQDFLINRAALGKRHYPSQFKVSAPAREGEFAEYVSNVRELLGKAYSASKLDNMDLRINGNAPFELWPEPNYRRKQGKPYRYGIVLTHGLTDSAYFMHPLAEFFRNIGWRVMTVLLPGHGTQPGDLLDIEWNEWADTIKFAVMQMNKEVEEVCMGGLSTGATLSLMHCLETSQIRGLFLYSPALGITRRAAYANLHKLYSWLRPSAKWVNIMPDISMFKYESFPVNAAYQVHCLIKHLRKNLQGNRLDVPVFIAASEDDATVRSLATLEFMASQHHPASRMVYYTQNPSISPAGIPQSRIERACSVIPEQNILSFSHTSLVLPPEDKYYGLNGEYSSCLHYYPHDMESYAACMHNSPAVLQGEVTDENLSKGVMRRLMYNPYFKELTVSMQRFIKDAL